MSRFERRLLLDIAEPYLGACEVRRVARIALVDVAAVAVVVNALALALTIAPAVTLLVCEALFVVAVVRAVV